jgi:hypothetical protein
MMNDELKKINALFIIQKPEKPGDTIQVSGKKLVLCP